MDHGARVYDTVFEMMPSEENPTPLVRINRLNRASAFPLYAKLEWMNPFGSVKDRAAWEMLRDLEERGEVGGQRGIVEPTSGIFKYTSRMVQHIPDLAAGTSA